MSLPSKSSVIYAITAAALFGASAPLAKLLLSGIPPVLLAALLYLGSGFGLLFYKLLLLATHQTAGQDAPLDRNDLPWLLYATLAGGIAAPIALLFGLRHTSAASASLLLSFEGIATALFAGLAFHEAIGRRVWIAVVLTTIATILLSVDATANWGISLGALGVLGACVLWGMDNNFTRNISGKDPVAIVIVKSIAAGLFNLLLAVLLGNRFPGSTAVFLSCLVGLCCYGLSIVLFIISLRGLGTARTSAYFAAAPFIGAALSFVLFRGWPNALFALSLPIMAAGVYLLVTEQHSHLHTHDALEHDHIHGHGDGHHGHDYPEPGDIRAHAHPHRHAAATHDHPHAPDLHHRHQH